MLLFVQAGMFTVTVEFVLLLDGNAARMAEGEQEAAVQEADVQLWA